MLTQTRDIRRSFKNCPLLVLVPALITFPRLETSTLEERNSANKYPTQPPRWKHTTRPVPNPDNFTPVCFHPNFKVHDTHWAKAFQGYQ